MATVNIAREVPQGLRTGLELTADGIAAFLGDPQETNVIEARKVSAFVQGMRADPTHAAVLTGGKAKKGELHPVVEAFMRKGYEESSAKQYRSKMLAIRNAYVATGYIPADGATWNGAYEQAREKNAEARLNGAIHRARAEASASLPKDADGDSIKAAMDAAESAVLESGGTRRKQTIESFVATIVKRCDSDGYDLGELIGRLQAIQDAVNVAPAQVNAPAPAVRQVAKMH